jgi:hypothetical protein
MDVVVDVRTRPGGTEWLAGWLEDRGFTMSDPSPDGIGHQFTKQAVGVGLITVDILAPEGLGPRTKRFTHRPARTVEAPGTVQALDRSQVVTVTVTGMTGAATRTGQVRRPAVLGALIGKAAATQIPVRRRPERDWQDAALLLSLVTDPIGARGDLSGEDWRRLGHLRPLLNPAHAA